MSYFMSSIIEQILSERKESHHLMNMNEDLDVINSLKTSIEKKLKNVYKEVTGKDLMLPQIEIKIDNNIKDGKIAGFNHPNNGENAEMGIKEKALKDKEYLKWVITHELIHASIGEDLPQSEEHEGLFNKLAHGMGLPEKYRD